jgi:hypothetical protein
MIEEVDVPRDLAVLAVPLVGVLEKTGDVFGPYRLLDAAGLTVVAVSEYLKDLQAAGRSQSTQRSYGMDLLRWFRPVGDRLGLGPGHSCGGPRFLPVVAVGGQAGSGALADRGVAGARRGQSGRGGGQRGDGQGVAWA